jgi:hypothetical protein
MREITSAAVGRELKAEGEKLSKAYLAKRFLCGFRFFGRGLI